MLNFDSAAKLARRQDKKRVSEASAQMSRSQAVIQKQRSFRTQLFAALTKQGTSKGALKLPDQLFVAFPEKLLEKWWYVAFGHQRAHDKASVEPQQSKDVEPEWQQWAELGGKCHFRKLDAGVPKKILLTHGLSPIEDSTLLLADIGRGVRTAGGLQAGACVMLADVSWMSHNRSIRKFDLSENEIEDGLVLCLDRRRRLYSSLKLEHRVHHILAYEEEGEISSEKISSIVERYKGLVKFLWGEGIWDTQDPLNNDQLKRLDAPLKRSLADDSPLRELSEFPSGIDSVERGLKLHLDVLKTLAKRFRHLNGEVVSYYFAQYYAQTSYRGSHLKVAVISEKDFDEPFDELDGCFSAWGAGHKITGMVQHQSDNPGLSGFYLPPYRINGWTSLPYTPLSSDALRSANNRCDVVRSHLPMINDQDPEKIAILLDGTRGMSVPELNRLCFDILSFVSYAQRVRGRGLVADAETVSGCGLEESLLLLGSEALRFSFDVESEEKGTESETRVQLGELWASWLDTLSGSEAADYVPSHLQIASLTKDDWNNERLTAATSLVRLANALVTVLVGEDLA